MTVDTISILINTLGYISEIIGFIFLYNSTPLTRPSTLTSNNATMIDNKREKSSKIGFKFIIFGSVIQILQQYIKLFF